MCAVDLRADEPVLVVAEDVALATEVDDEWHFVLDVLGEALAADRQVAVDAHEVRIVRVLAGRSPQS